MFRKAVADISKRMCDTFPWVREVPGILRMDPKGILVLEGGETWKGIDDRSIGRVYIRYRDGWDALYDTEKLTSCGSTMRATHRMRCVGMHLQKCDMADTVASFLRSCKDPSGGYSVKVLQATNDKQFVVTSETPLNGIPDDRLRLFMVDFDLRVRVSTFDPSCLPDCHEC